MLCSVRSVIIKTLKARNKLSFERLIHQRMGELWVSKLYFSLPFLSVWIYSSSFPELLQVLGMKTSLLVDFTINY